MEVNLISYLSVCLVVGYIIVWKYSEEEIFSHSIIPPHSLKNLGGGIGAAWEWGKVVTEKLNTLFHVQN